MTRIALSLSFALLSTVTFRVAGASEPVVSSAGSDVVISIGGIATASNHASAHADQIEIPLTSGSATPRKFNFDDPTIKRVEITDDTLIVTVHHSRESTLLTAQQARIDGGGSHVRITLPRNPRHTVADADTASQPAPVSAPERPLKTEAPKAEPAKAPQAAQPETKIVAPPADPIAVAVAANSAPAIADITAPPPSSRGAWWLIGLGIVGAAALFLARKKRPGSRGDGADLLRVIASRSLGGKSRLLLVEAKGQKLLISVDERGTRLISQVNGDDEPDAKDVDNDADRADDNDHDIGRTGRTGRIGNDKTFGEALGLSRYTDLSDETHEPEKRDSGKPKSSPAVAGLLKLRQDKAAASDDRDWLAELANATKRAGGKS